MKKIHFIVNPISGSGRQLNELNSVLIDKTFDHDDYHVTLSFTRRRNDTVDFVREAITSNADIIVACGGDGTISQIAQHLVNTDISLGIIPRGSGNGLATHLGIPLRLKEALQIIKEGHSTHIDVGSAGDDYFFSNFGTGFAAEVIYRYDQIPERKLPGYIKAGLASLHAIKDSRKLVVSADEKKLETRHLFISNSNIMGYNMTLTPEASLEDGLFDIVSCPYRSLAAFTAFGFMALFRSLHLLKKVDTFRTDHLTINSEQGNFKIQLDGEPKIIHSNTLQIKLLPKALKIIIPK